MLGIFVIMSIVLGGIAIFLPVIAIWKKGNNHLFSNLSLSCCLLSLYALISEYNHLVNVQDWDAMVTTSAIFVKASFALVMIVIMLNLISYRFNHKRR